MSAYQRIYIKCVNTRAIKIVGVGEAEAEVPIDSRGQVAEAELY